MYEDIYEQIMDLIMEWEGAELAAEMERLNKDPAAAVPEDLHQQCLDMINATFLP